MPHRQFPSSELCITHKFSNRSPSNPNGIPPQSPGLGGTTYPGNNVQEGFSTPKVLRQSSAIWAQPRWGCFEAGPRTQGRPAAVAEGQPWAGGRNPVGIKGNEAAPQIANLWVMHSSEEGLGGMALVEGAGSKVFSPEEGGPMSALGIRVNCHERQRRRANSPE
ncbi:MAG: hypothetical protein ACI9VS_001091 [Candidatus Binatia bacterium]|jgi:hypothetical protein